jgi:hypothetical protein
MMDGFEGVVGRSRKRTRRHGLKRMTGRQRKGCGYNNQLEAGANGGMERVGDRVASETECILYNAKHSFGARLRA